MLPEIRMPSLRGQGDRWEQEVRQRFGRDQNTYVAPDSFQSSQGRQLVQDISQAVADRDPGQLDQLNTKASALGLALTEVKTDKDNYVLLHEPELHKGWGQVLFRVPGPTDSVHAPKLIVEVPHPGFDGGTPELGLEIFEKTQADVLLMAGAHRFNRPEPSPVQPDRKLADPAHSPVTFFHAAHEGLQGPGQVVLQIHGFSARTPSDPQAVLSDGQEDHFDPPALLGLDESLRRQGLSTRVVDFQEDWLTGRANLQGQAMAQDQLLGPHGPSQFVHIEFDKSLRKGPDRSDSFGKIVQAVEDWRLSSAAGNR